MARKSVTTIPMRPRSLSAGEGGTRLAEEGADGLGGSLRRARLAGRTDQAAANNRAIGEATDFGRLSGGADPETDRNRDLRLILGRGHQIGELHRNRVPLAGRTDRRDEVDEPARDGADLSATLRRRGWGDQRD